jgi:hypothetical protein
MAQLEFLCAMAGLALIVIVVGTVLVIDRVKQNR